MQFVKDAESKSYERKVFGFLEVTGNIGGLFEIMEIFGGFLVGLFSQKMFLYSILSKLYHIEEPEEDKGGNINWFVDYFHRPRLHQEAIKTPSSRGYSKCKNLLGICLGKREQYWKPCEE